MKCLSLRITYGAAGEQNGRWILTWGCWLSSSRGAYPIVVVGVLGLGARCVLLLLGVDKG